MITALHTWARRRRDLTLATTITRWLLAIGDGLLVLMLGTRGLPPGMLTVPALAVAVVFLPFALGSWAAFLPKG